MEKLVSFRNLMLRPCPEFKTPQFLLKNFLRSSPPENVDCLSNRINWVEGNVYKKIIEFSSYGRCDYNISVYYDFGNKLDLESDENLKNSRFWGSRDRELNSYWNEDCRAWVELKLTVSKKRTLIHKFGVEVFPTLAETQLNAWNRFYDKCLLLKGGK